MRVFLLISLFISNVCFAKEGTFFGKYKAVAYHDLYDEGSIEFLLRSSGEFTVVSDQWEQNLNLVAVNNIEVDHSFGPSMESLEIRFESGSDEDGITYTVELAWLGYEGERELTLISNLMRYADGPNSVYTAEKNKVRLYKWSKKDKEYKEIPNL